MSDSTMVREKCACGAEFEMSDSGQWAVADTSVNVSPLALVELRKWRAEHACAARPTA